MTKKKAIMLVLLCIANVVLIIFLCLQAQKDSDDARTSVYRQAPWHATYSLQHQLDIVDAVHKKWFGDRIDVLSTEYGKKVVCDWFSYKSYIASVDATFEEVLEQFLADSMHNATVNGFKGDYWASVAAFEMLVDAVNANDDISKITDMCLPYAPDIKRILPLELTNFKKLATLENLLDANGKVDKSKLQTTFLIYRSLWVRASEQKLPHRAIYPVEEELAMYRWQVEVSQMSIDKKLEKLEQMDSLFPEMYDAKYAAAMLNVEYGDPAYGCKLIKTLYFETPEEDKTKRELYGGAYKFINESYPKACDAAEEQAPQAEN